MRYTLQPQCGTSSLTNNHFSSLNVDVPSLQINKNTTHLEELRDKTEKEEDLIHGWLHKQAKERHGKEKYQGEIK